MITFKNLSIKSKLARIITLTSCIALLAASVAFRELISFMFRNSMLEEVSNLAEITGKLCPCQKTPDASGKGLYYQSDRLEF